jgi:Sortase domain
MAGGGVPYLGPTQEIGRRMLRGSKVTLGATSLLVALLAVAGTALVWVGLGDRRSPPPAPAGVAGHATATTAPQQPHGHVRSKAQRMRTVGGTGAGTRGGVPDLIAGTVLPASRPVSIAIPRLRIHSKLVQLGIDGTGAMDVPSDPGEAGWYDRGPTPGELGPAVIAGHVTWNLQPAVFFRLGDLRSGDRLRVVRRDGVTGVFEVRQIRSFPKVRFPTKAVFGTIDYAGLRLITCGGTYDASTHRYLDNLVVFARLVAARPASGDVTSN